MVNKKTALGVVLLILLATGGVGGYRYYVDNIRLPDVSPRQVVEQYFAALKNRDYKKAYGFVSQEYYHDSYNQFVDRVAMYSPQMRVETQGEVVVKDKATVNIRVFVPMAFGPYTSDSSMDLVRSKREWKIISP